MAYLPLQVLTEWYSCSDVGPLDMCFPRERLAGDMDVHNHITYVQTCGTAKLREQFEKNQFTEPCDLKLVALGAAITHTSTFGGARLTKPAAKTKPEKTKPVAKRKRLASPRSDRVQLQDRKGCNAA